MSATQTLRAIEARAERAIVQELKIMARDVLAIRPTLPPEERAYADGLLLKLDQLARNQLVQMEQDHAVLVQNLLMAAEKMPGDVTEAVSAAA